MGSEWLITLVSGHPIVATRVDEMTYAHTIKQEEAAAAGKPKIKKPAGKSAGKVNELKELEAQLKAMELAKKQKEEKRKAAAAATKVGLVGLR